MFELPHVLQSYIYEFDPTYRDVFQRVLNDIEHINQVPFDIDYDYYFIDEMIDDYYDDDDNFFYDPYYML